MAWTAKIKEQDKMKIKILLSENTYTIDLSDPLDISIPLYFNGEQPNCYNVPMASAKAYDDGQFIGDTRRGGGCNFETYQFVTHCNGTHTECVGHIALDRISIHKIPMDVFIPSTLITVIPEEALSSTDTYKPEKLPTDYFITVKSLFYKLQNISKDFLRGLIIRTLPNDDSKCRRNYLKDSPPFFSLEAMDYLGELGVQHLLVDLPSVDRTFDNGQLSAHHIYWEVPQGGHDVDPEGYSLKTITEMIYVPDTISDGRYFVNLQTPNFVTDAVPSRPVLHALNLNDRENI
jgi:arylformamidase